MKFRFVILYLLTIIFIASTFSGSSLKNNNNIRQIVNQKLSSDFYTRLYSNTYYSLLSRIDSDGYLQESMTGQYDGMYCRTVGAIVPLFLETKNYDKAELLLKFVFKVMKMNGMNRVPHVIGKRIIHIGNQEKDSLYIIGKTDQIDGQAHNILAWARLALQHGHTSFEDSTWDFVAALMNRSTEEPYMGSNKNGFIPNLIHNFNFEHSRPLPTSYDLLTQCFTGAALEAMIQVAKRRDDNARLNLWNQKLNILKTGIKKYMTRIVDGKQIYLELLAKEGNLNIPFSGFSWVNLSPVAAQWEPLNHSVLVNTIKEIQKLTIQQWNKIEWMPTDWWPDGSFSGQMIGKGIGWEIEFSREEKDWERINQILSLLEIIQFNEPIYMENSFLTTGLNHSIEHLNQNDLKKMNDGVWKIVDPGNGEQAAWWWWAVAKLREELGLPAIPEKLCAVPDIDISHEDKTKASIEIISNPGTLIYYSIDGSEPSKNSIRYTGSFTIEKPAKIKAVVYNEEHSVSNIKSLNILSLYSGLEFSCFPDVNNDKHFIWINGTPSYSGYSKNFNVNDFISNQNKCGIINKGYLKISREGNYKFFIITLNHSRLFIDKRLISFDANSLSGNKIKEIRLNKGFHELSLESECSSKNGKTEIYFSMDNEPREIIDSSMLLVKIPGDENILPPRILPLQTEFDIDSPIFVSIDSFDSSEIFYTLDGSDPNKNSLIYKNPFEINATMTVKAAAIRNNQISSVSIMNYKQTEKNKITLKFAPNLKYYAMGPASLLDGIYGSTNSGDGNWLGFEGDDLDAAIDLRKIRKVNEIKTDFLNNPGSWIFLPEEIKYFVSLDGKNFEEVYSTIPDSINQHNKNSEIKKYSVKLKHEEVRFIRISAKNMGVCPKWHPGDGNKAWLFIDEIYIK